VTSTGVGGVRTQIDLACRNLVRFGAEAVRKAFSGEGGWATLLAAFAKVVEAS